MDLKVICVNNLTYAMTGGQTAPTTPGKVISATNPYGVFEPSFNLVALAEAAGASYVARWTTYHVKQLARSMEEVLKKKGFCFIEVLSPCPTLYQRRNKMGDGLDTMKYYKEVSKVRHGARTSECELTKSGEIVVGKFVDRDRPDYFELLRAPDDRIAGRPLSRNRRSHAANANGNSYRRIWRPGRDSGRGGNRQSHRHFRGRPRHHDAELRPGGARRFFQRAGDSFDRADSLSLHHAARTSWW